MKNITKIISAFAVFALAFSLFAGVAEAQLGGNSSSGTNGGLSSNSSSGTSGGLSSNNSSGTQTGGLSSNNSSGTQTGGLGSNNSSGTETGSGSNSGSDNDSSGSRSRARGGSSGSVIKPRISNVNIEALGSDMVRISWTTSIPAISQLVYGPASKEAVSNAVNFGYAFGSNVSAAKTTEHAFAVIIKPGQTVFVRPVSANGRSVYFGQELALTKHAVVSKPAVKTSQPVIGGVKNEGTESTVIIDITSSDVNENEVIEAGEGEANVGTTDASGKVGNFFKKIWNFLIGKK